MYLKKKQNIDFRVYLQTIVFNKLFRRISVFLKRSRNSNARGK